MPAWKQFLFLRKDYNLLCVSGCPARPGTRSTALRGPKPQLHVSTEQVYLIQQEVHVLPAHLRANHHLAEKVHLSPVGLVAQHEASLLHHLLLYGWGHLQGEKRGRWNSTTQKHLSCIFISFSPVDRPFLCAQGYNNNNNNNNINNLLGTWST